jgi:hypothetical protein
LALDLWVVLITTTSDSIKGDILGVNVADQFTACRVLYLDFDGVLHDEEVYWDVRRGIYLRTPGRELFEWMPILESLLAPHSDVRIVLSTSWVPMRGFNFAKKCLSQSLKVRVVGSTFHKRYMRKDDFMYLPRGVQIGQDLSRRNPRHWLAIDDDDIGWPRWLRNNLVCTDGASGISVPEIQYAISNWLEKTC